MTTETTDQHNPAVKQADALEVGEYVMHQETPFDPRRPMRVLFAHPYQDGDGIRRVALMLDSTDGPLSERPNISDRFEMADEQDMAAFRDAGARQALAQKLHQLANDIVEKQPPLPRYRFHVGPGVLESRADLDRWAAYLGVEVKGGTADDPIPSANAELPVVGSVVLDIHAQSRKVEG